MAHQAEEKPFFGLTGGWLTVWITIACATDMMLFGYDQGVFSGVVVTKDFLELHDLVGPSKTNMLGTVTAIYDIGCFVGAIVAFTIGERLGRNKVVLLGTAIMAVGTLIKVTSYSLPQIFVGRIILGIGNGINTSTASIWQTATSQAKWRGKLVMLEMMMNIAGFTFVNWLNYGLSHVSGSVAWRSPLALQFVFIFILFATVPWLPESPRWLAAQGRTQEAIQILACLEAKGSNDPYVATQLSEIEESVKYEREHTVSWRDLFFWRKSDQGDTKTLRRLLLGANTQLMQQFGGISIMSYYLPTVLIQSVGLSEQKARLLAAINAITYLIFSCVSIPLIERYGRRGLMLLSTAGQFGSFLIIAVLLQLSESRDNGETFGMLGIPWLYPTEINSLPMRTKGAAFVTGTNWITNFVIVQITPIGIQSLRWEFWIIWTVFNAVFLPVIYFLYPETSNRHLEDMDMYYRSNPSVIITKDADAVCTARPLKYIKNEDAELRRRRTSLAGSVMEVSGNDQKA